MHPLGPFAFTELTKINFCSLYDVKMLGKDGMLGTLHFYTPNCEQELVQNVYWIGANVFHPGDTVRLNIYTDDIPVQASIKEAPLVHEIGDSLFIQPCITVRGREVSRSTIEWLYKHKTLRVLATQEFNGVSFMRQIRGNPENKAGGYGEDALSYGFIADTYSICAQDVYLCDAETGMPMFNSGAKYHGITVDAPLEEQQKYIKAVPAEVLELICSDLSIKPLEECADVVIP